MELISIDPKIYSLLGKENLRQQETINLIASENYVSAAVLEATASALTNKYSEGYPQQRFYQGNAVVDAVENLAIARAKKVFCAEHANVQPYSGSPANGAVYMAFLGPGDTFIGFDLSCGGSKLNMKERSDNHHYSFFILHYSFARPGRPSI